MTGDGQAHSSLDTSLRHLPEEVFCSTNHQSGVEVYTSVNSSLSDLACDFESFLGVSGSRVNSLVGGRRGGWRSE